jgi:hypothetical protein
VVDVRNADVMMSGPVRRHGERHEDHGQREATDHDVTLLVDEGELPTFLQIAD